MIKKFLLGVVVLCGGSVANAALIVSYNFTGSTGADTFTPSNVDYGSTGAVAPDSTNFSDVLTASQWRNSPNSGTTNGVPGSISNNAWRTANTITNTTPDTTRSNRLDLTPIAQSLGDGLITIDSIKFDLARIGGVATSTSKINLLVQFRPDSDADYVTVGTGDSNTDTTFKSNTITLISPIVFTKDSTQANFRFVWSRVTGGTGTHTQRATLDNLEFHGTYTPPPSNLVPEPASIVVFGLLGAGVAARRLRRKA